MTCSDFKIEKIEGGFNYFTNNRKTEDFYIFETDYYQYFFYN